MTMHSNLLTAMNILKRDSSRERSGLRKPRRRNSP